MLSIVVGTQHQSDWDWNSSGGIKNKTRRRRKESSFADPLNSSPPKRDGNFTWRSEAAKASWELFSRVRNWEQMLRASLAALRLSMASWATLRFHSGVMAGGLTNVILWMIWEQGQTGRQNLQGDTKRFQLERLINDPPAWFAPRRVWSQRIPTGRWLPRGRRR